MQNINYNGQNITSISTFIVDSRFENGNTTSKVKFCKCCRTMMLIWLTVISFMEKITCSTNTFYEGKDGEKETGLGYSIKVCRERSMLN